MDCFFDEIKGSTSESLYLVRLHCVPSTVVAKSSVDDINDSLLKCDSLITKSL